MPAHVVVSHFPALDAWLRVKDWVSVSHGHSKEGHKEPLQDGICSKWSTPRDGVQRDHGIATADNRESILSNFRIASDRLKQG